jgi:MFS transporter, ACS family, glucarate transporter
MPRRYMLIGATFLLSMLLYVDRICISVAKKPISEELTFSNKDMGWIFAAFSLGYALFQTPAGAAADRFGPRRVLTFVVAGWSIFTALTAGAWNWITMLVVRFIFGAGEAGAFPGMARAFYSWLPMQERGLAHGINFSASRLGAALALPVIAMLVANLGVLWAIAWYVWFRDDPATDTRLTDEERAYILQNRQQTTALKPHLSTGQLLTSPNMWLMMIQYFASNFSFFFALTWLLPLLQDRYKLSATEAGWLGALPLIGGMLGNWCSGFLVDLWHRHGKPLSSRTRVATMGFTCASIGMLVLSQADTLLITMVGLVLAVFGADMTLSPSWSYCTDIGGPNAGTVSGTMNMAGNIGSFVTSLAFPYLLEWTGSPMPFFFVAASLNILALVSWQFVSSRAITEGRP